MFCIMISVAVIVLVLVLLVAFLARPAPRRHDVELQTHIAQPRATANLSELVTGIVNGPLFGAVVAEQLSPGQDSTELVTGITNGNYPLETEVTPADVLRLEVVPSQENYQDHISTIVPEIILFKL